MELTRIVKGAFTGSERAEGDMGADQWATAIIKVACILIIGVVILNGVTTAANVTTGPFAGLMTSVNANISAGYTLMALAIGAGAIMHFLGFM